MGSAFFRIQRKALLGMLNPAYDNILLNDHRLKAVGFLAAESRIGAKAP
jgi:hypothetical protein